ncbi:MAG: thioredoxin family protein [Gammaproteobacteria bacterium]|jgi:peroxiredoxin
MKKLFLTLVTALVVAGTAHAQPVIGQPAPELTATDTKGVSHSLSDFRGKTVVLEWTNHDCPYVKKHYDTGNMQALQREATAEGVVWLTIISSAPGKQGYVTAEEADALTAERDAAPTAVLFDPEGTAGKAYGARTTPHMFVIDPEGTLVYMGGIDDRPTASKEDVEGARNYVREALTALRSGQDVPQSTSRPYGCSIKYKS